MARSKLSFPVISSRPLSPEKRLLQIQLHMVSLITDLELPCRSDRADLIRTGNTFLVQLRAAINRVAPGRLRHP